MIVFLLAVRNFFQSPLETEATCIQYSLARYSPSDRIGPLKIIHMLDYVSPKHYVVMFDYFPQNRLLTGPDDAIFCRKVSEILDSGYTLITAQAVIQKQPTAE